MTIYNQFCGDARPHSPLYGNIQSIMWRRRSKVSPIWQYTINIVAMQVHCPLYNNIQSILWRRSATVSRKWQYTINIGATQVHSLPYMAIYNQHCGDAGPQSSLYGNIQSILWRRRATVSREWQYTINFVATLVHCLTYMTIYNQYCGDAGPLFPI